MANKLELVAETKLYRLLPGGKKSDRLEASGVIIVDPATCYVVFDNSTHVARLNPSIESRKNNKLIPTISPSDGFESIAWDPEAGRFFLLVEALKDCDGKRRGYVVEYDRNFVFQRCSRLDKCFKSKNKGFEGLVHHRHHDRECLWALCEGNLCKKKTKGGGRIQVFRRTSEQNWLPEEEIKLPDSAELKDYSAIAITGQRVAIVSQHSRRVWIGELDDTGHRFREGGAVYRFPKGCYCNVEGAAWLSPTRLLTVSDRHKKEQEKCCEDKDQSIHIFDIPTS
jgi:hypothetical protein